MIKYLAGGTVADVKGAWDNVSGCSGFILHMCRHEHKSQRGGQEKQSVTSPQGASLGLSNVDLKYSA